MDFLDHQKTGVSWTTRSADVRSSSAPGYYPHEWMYGLTYIGPKYIDRGPTVNDYSELGNWSTGPFTDDPPNPSYAYVRSDCYRVKTVFYTFEEPVITFSFASNPAHGDVSLTDGEGNEILNEGSIGTWSYYRELDSIIHYLDIQNYYDVYQLNVYDINLIDTNGYINYTGENYEVTKLSEEEILYVAKDEKTFKFDDKFEIKNIILNDDSSQIIGFEFEPLTIFNSFFDGDKTIKIEKVPDVVEYYSILDDDNESIITDLNLCGFFKLNEDGNLYVNYSDEQLFDYKGAPLTSASIDVNRQFFNFSSDDGENFKSDLLNVQDDVESIEKNNNNLVSSFIQLYFDKECKRPFELVKNDNNKYEIVYYTAEGYKTELDRINQGDYIVAFKYLTIKNFEWHYVTSSYEYVFAEDWYNVNSYINSKKFTDQYSEYYRLNILEVNADSDTNIIENEQELTRNKFIKSFYK